MPDQRSIRVPKYRLHKPSGLAVVRLNGRDIYLGRHGTEDSHRQYEQVIAEWLSNRRQLALRQELLDSPHAVSVGELVLAYLEHAEEYYVKNGRPTGECGNIEDAVRELSRLYRRTLVADFGPTEFKAVRHAMIQADLCRNVINVRINRIRRIFKWGVGHQLVSTSVLQALQSVDATPEGALLTTMRFLAIAETTATQVAMLPEGGSPLTQTVVWDALTPNHPINVTLDVTTISIVTPGDFDANGTVNRIDFPQFHHCLTGPGGALDAGCQVGDFDLDDDVDLRDWAGFQNAFAATG